MKWLEPWSEVRDSMSETFLRAWEKQLALETGPGHPLYQMNAKIIGRRFDCDDALFQLEDGRVAMVEMTWSKKQERNPYFPRTHIYDSLWAWEQDALASDHAEWVLGGG